MPEQETDRYRADCFHRSGKCLKQQVTVISFKIGKVSAMTNETEKFERQMEAAREGMDRYRTALSALAGKDTSEELRTQIEVARERMTKYQAVYRALAK